MGGAVASLGDGHPILSARCRARCALSTRP